MRYFRIFSAMFICSLLIASCSKPDGGDTVIPASIEVNMTSLAVTSSGGSFQIELQASHDWVAECESWIHVTPSSGAGSSRYQFITVDVDKNTSSGETVNARKGSIRFRLKDLDNSAEIAVDQEGESGFLTIAEFQNKSADKNTWHTVRGVITSIESKTLGDFYIKDDTGEILVYGMTAKKNTTNDKSFASLGLKEGDMLTFCAVRSEYRGEAQAGADGAPAYYVGHKEGTEPAPVYKDFKAASAKADWMELPATSDSDGLTLLYHGLKIGSKPYRNYTAYYDKDNLLSHWVAYPLTRKTIGYGTRTDAWAADPLLEEDEQPVLSNSSYKPGNAGSYSRGHQLPSADRLAYEANTKTFYGTNMTPQEAGFNEGVWETLENQVRVWAKKSDTDTLYVVTGCVTKGSTLYALDNKGKKVTVPAAYYKALLRLSGKDWSACAFYFEHQSNNDTDIKKYVMSIDALEEKTGVDFFVNLPAKAGKDEAARIEAANPVDKSWWWSNLAN